MVRTRGLVYAGVFSASLVVGCGLDERDVGVAVGSSLPEAGAGGQGGDAGDAGGGGQAGELGRAGQPEAAAGSSMVESPPSDDADAGGTPASGRDAAGDTSAEPAGDAPEGTIGAACAADAECARGTCLGAPGSDFFDTGGPPEGYCSFGCQLEADCTARDPVASCLPLRPGSASYCIVIICGDATVTPGEECDNGVNVDTYEVSAGACAPGCVRPPRCGDGVVDGAWGETCDDGINDGSYGGCTEQCVPGPRCGDGTLDEGEACDDANSESGDGCDNACRIEP